MAKESSGEYSEIHGLLDGRGLAKIHTYFTGKTHPGIWFAELVFAPSAYAGFHEHPVHDSILYIISGTAEHYQEENRETLGPGDAVLVKAGRAHAIKNTGAVDLKIVEVCAVPGVVAGTDASAKRLPLPSSLSDW